MEKPLAVRRPSASARAAASSRVAKTARERIEDALRLGRQGREIQKRAQRANDDRAKRPAAAR